MRTEVFLQGLISFLIIAFGQPSFAPWLAPIAGAVGYALFWRAIRIYPFSSQRFWRSTLWYGAVTLIQLSWMSSIEFQGIYILGVWLALSIWLGMQFGLLSILIPYNRHLSFPRILCIASLWTLIEWSRYHILCGYSWNLSGMALSTSYAMQAATVFGILGLSFWVIFVNLVGLRAFTRKGIQRYIVWGAFAALPYFFGFLHVQHHNRNLAKREDLKPYHCMLVQTGLLPSQKVPLEGQFSSFISPYEQWKRILVYLKESGETSSDLIVFPEAAVPFSSEQEVYQKQKVKAIFQEVYGPTDPFLFPENEKERVANIYWMQTLANLYDSEVVLGVDHVDGDGKAYNSAFHTSPHAEKMTRYDKRVLMPLAEYLPFKILIPLVKSYGISDFFTHGKAAHLFRGKIPLSTSICYEETFPGKVREGRLSGAKLLVNITNDGWYPYSRLPNQHFEHSRLRALENGVPLLRSCNTGITAIVDSLGRTLAELPSCDEKKQHHAGVLSVKLLPYEYATLFTLWGNLGIVLISLFFIGIFVLFKKEFHW